MEFYSVIDISSFVALLPETASSQRGIIEHGDALVASLGYGGGKPHGVSSLSLPYLDFDHRVRLRVLGEGGGAWAQLGAGDGGGMERVWECRRMRG